MCLYVLDFDYALLKPIPSKYVVGKGFVDKWVPLDGKTTNVSHLGWPIQVMRVYS